MKTRVITINEFDLHLKKLGKLDATKALQRAGLEIETKAKKLCPVDTGTLRRSITHEVANNELVVGTNVEYAPYLEFGTGIYASEGDGRKTPWTYMSADGEFHTTQGQHPQPFLFPAGDDVKDKIAGYITEELMKELGRA